MLADAPPEEQERVFCDVEEYPQPAASLAHPAPSHNSPASDWMGCLQSSHLLSTEHPK